MKTINTIVVTSEQAERAEKMLKFFSNNVRREDHNGTAAIKFVADEQTVKRIFKEVSFS